MFVMAHLSRWLAGEGLSAGELTPQVAERFLAVRRAAGYVLYLSPKALVPLVSYLRRIKVVPEPVPAPLSVPEQVLDGYRYYLRAERGVTTATARCYLDLVRPFVTAHARPDGTGLDQLTAAQITRYVVDRCSSLAKGTAELSITALRSLLGWLHVTGVIAEPLAWAVPSVAARRRGVPRPLEAGQVTAMLSSFDRDTPAGRRDHAMLTLLARLGLRAGEVAALELGDIDWRAGEITIRGKGNRRERLPLPADVGQTIADYLRHGRPDPFEGTRRVFLRVRAPHRGMTTGGVTAAVFAAGRRAGIGDVYAHRLRHSAATQMQQAGADLVEIGQVLRHERLLTTKIYAKTDIDALRTLARPWPGGGMK